MPELRKNPLDGGWVVVSPERSARPDTFRDADAGRSTGAGDGEPDDCPFCPGHENETPPEVARTGDGRPDTPGWRIRVVPNLYPIVDGEPRRVSATGSRFHDATRGTGRHEVVVMSPGHHRSLADLTGVELEELFEVLAARIRHHQQAGHEYVQVLVNHGRAAGASIEHPHLQIVAIDLTAPVVVREADHIARSAECPVCRAVHEDADPTAPLVVAANRPAPVWCPWWAAVPYEIMVAPRDHRPRMEFAGPALADVARSTGEATALLRRVLGDVPYNLVVHTAPHAEGGDFHWHIHLWPRLTVKAGFEEGTGVMVNQVPPETAAAALRAAGTTGT